MGEQFNAVFYFGGGVLLLATVLWLLATVYLYLLHVKYAHIPRPPMPRYMLLLYVYNLIKSEPTTSLTPHDVLHVLI